MLSCVCLVVLTFTLIHRGHFRESGAMVIHALVIMKEEIIKDEENDLHAYNSLENSFVEGTWNCEFADEVKPSGSDIILSNNRISFSAFRGTKLKDIVEIRGITSLFVMGFLSNVCVEETTIEARELFPDMKIYVCSDGCAAKSKQVRCDILSFVLEYAFCSCLNKLRFIFAGTLCCHG